MDTSTFFENLWKEVARRIDEEGPFFEAFAKESDRASAILSACVLDDLLGKIIQASYVRDTHVKSLFKNDHILQSFFAKINIAYFSGLIPDVIYHDLKLICEIRNKFAHAVIADLGFTNESVVRRIDRFELGPKTATGMSAPRIKFFFVVSQILAVLKVLEHILEKSRPLHLVEKLNLNVAQSAEWPLTQTEISNLLKRVSISSNIAKAKAEPKSDNEPNS